MSRLKILNVVNGREIGGAETLLLTMADKYDSQRFDIHYCNVFFSSGPFVDEIRRRGLPLTVISGTTLGRLPAMIARLALFIRREKFDIVQTHLMHSTIVGQVASEMARSPVMLVTRHYTDEVYAGKPRMLRVADEMLTRRATHVVAVSESVRQGLLDVGVSARRISVIHNGIDSGALKRVFEGAPAAASAACFRIGCVGSLQKRKGHAVVIAAMALIVQHIPAHLTIVGEGPERRSLEQLAADLGIADRVDLLGFSADATSLLPSLDAYVQPSLQEPFGIAVLEAMAAAKPVIASRTGGIPEIITDGVDGLLVTPGAAAELADAIVRIARDPLLAARLGRYARRRVETAFDVRVAARQYEQLYTSLTARFRGGDVL